MAAITWQNINGPSLAEASRPLEAAQRGVASMFSGFEDILKRREATQTANWDQTKLNNTNALLSAVQGAKTPEEYAAMEAGLREQMAGYGAQVDAAAGRNALDGRLGTLQQRAVAAQQFTDQKAEVEGRIPKAMFMGAILNTKDKAGSDVINLGIQGALGNGTLSPAAATELLQKGVERGQNLVTQSNAATTFADQQTKFKQEQLLYPNQVTASNNALLLQEANIENLQAEAAKAKNDKLYGSKEDQALQQAAFDKRLAGTLMSGGVWNSVKGRTAIGTNMKASELTGDNLQSVYDKVAAKFPNGIPFPETDATGKLTGKTSYKPLPTQLVQQAIDGTDNSYISYLGGTFGGRVADNLEALLKKPETRQQLIEGYQAQLDADTRGNNVSTLIEDVSPSVNAQSIKDVLKASKVSELSKNRFDATTVLDAAYRKRVEQLNK